MSSSLSRRTALQAAGVLAVSSMAAGVGGTAQAATGETGSTGDIVVVHPALPQVPVNNSFTVKVRWSAAVGRESASTWPSWL